MSTRFHHSAEHHPPILTLLVGLHASDSSRSQSRLLAIVDTSPDMTLIPLSMLEQIDAPELDEVRLRSHWGETTIAEDVMSITLFSSTRGPDKRLNHVV